MMDWRIRLAADIESLLVVAGATTVTVTLTARQARDLISALRIAPALSGPEARGPAQVKGSVE